MKKRKPTRMRVDFRKKRESRTREDADLTNQYRDQADEIDTLQSERVSGKGALSRRRTVVVDNGSEIDSGASDSVKSGNDTALLRGLVLRVHGLECIVRTEDHREIRCAVRRVLKSLATDERHVVVAGDYVQFRPEGVSQGLIMHIEPRTGTLSRTSRQRRHVLVANVDQILIVTSAGEPTIKPHLIDRFLITAEQNSLPACIAINKCDLIDPAELQPLIGCYAQMGYPTLMLSAKNGWGRARLVRLLAGKKSVVVGQSGVGKSSLLNMVEPTLGQRVQAVSSENQKGKHTTTTAEVFPLEQGGAVIDTPGIRQFQLYDIEPAEVAGLFRDIRPFASQCRFPNCTHQHEIDCAVKDALADFRLDVRRYESYCQMIEESNGKQ